MKKNLLRNDLQSEYSVFPEQVYSNRPTFCLASDRLDLVRSSRRFFYFGLMRDCKGDIRHSSDRILEDTYTARPERSRRFVKCIFLVV